MMLSWKMAACLAVGNTVVIKPAQVCPLTALKFAELSAKAGIPPGVINIVTGSGIFLLEFKMLILNNYAFKVPWLGKLLLTIQMSGS